MLKVITKMLIALFGIIVLLILVVVIFINTAPQFGQIPEGEDLKRIEESENYKDGIFQNLIETKMGSFNEMMKTVPESLFGKGGSPEKPLPTEFEDLNEDILDSICYVTWFGHSAFLIEMEGKRFLIDPMFGPSSSPVEFITKRFTYEESIPLEEIKNIDAVILSHDHYDHLDYPSILKLKDHVDHFFTPLGLGSHLKSWGVEANKITELDWWDETNYMDLKLVACPARHFSGRGINDRYKTQWASWVIKGEKSNIYFSGDGGYGPHFKEIGQKYGPFDFAMMECGQYNPAWAAIHMMPEESVQAGIDVGAKLLMPIHWGAFKLAPHSWVDPIERFKKKSKELNAQIIHPVIGEKVNIQNPNPSEEWWNNY